MNVNLIAGILHEATGEHAEAFAARSLFEPLGIKEWDWQPYKTDGFNLMDGSLRLRSRDMAKIGVMALNRGVWKGDQVVDGEWIRRSLAPQLSTGTPGEGYGYLWWTMHLPGPDGDQLEVHFANGWGSQFILIFPALDLVVVTTGGNQENGKHLAIGQVLIQQLLPGVGQYSQ
jgi:CubicO group peptidase (beta-lactamase class C family)